jgi:P-type Ca2+ transporter type 2C
LGSVEYFMRDIDVDSIKGLSSAQVSQKLKTEGYNELPSSGKRGILSIAFSVFKEPIFLLLVASGSLYFILGDVTEGIVLLSFVFVIIGITVYQEQKTENALDALKNLSSPRALVIRDGVQKRIPGREVVSGDIIILAEGDRVPADCLLLTSNNLMVDEALLTGESVPVRKVVWNGEEQTYRAGGDDLPFAYSGTLVIQGQAIAEVKSTGSKTEMGKIGAVLQKVERDETRLKKEISLIVRNSAIVGLSLCAIIIVVYGITRLDWIQGFLAGITLAMAVLPEEFPVVLTIFLALGAWRMSKKNVLTRQVHAIENLGGATVLCVDKTGTLTQNKMSVHKLFANGKQCELESSANMPPDFCHEVLEFSVLACKEDPFDPMEKAIKSFTEGEFSKTEHVHDDWQLVQEYPLSQKLLAMSNVWMSPSGEDYIIAAKGAPEAIFDLCHFDTEKAKALSFHVQAMAQEGLRVLGVANASFKKTDLPLEQHDFVFSFMGLIGFEDPVRPNVEGAVKECYSAGIRVVMITGDYPLTAQNIARQIGLKSPENCITGLELDQMSEEALQQRIGNVNIFARVVPEQKLRIVNAFKSSGEVVAMTGDGVNDAPALKSANIGIAMGGRGTDVARESASMVLLDDDFTSIVSGVRMGRRIYDNLKKAIAYIFSIHIPIAGMSVIPVLFGWPLILLPLHIVFLELIIDPACSVVFETEGEEAKIMSRKPRSMDKKLFNREAAVVAFLQGFVVLLIVALMFISSINQGLGEQTARTMAFATIVTANIALILSNRSWAHTIVGTLRKPNKAFWWILAVAMTALIIVIYVPQLSGLFAFSPLNSFNLFVSVGAGLVSIIWFEIYKAIKIFRSRKDLRIIE